MNDDPGHSENPWLDVRSRDEFRARVRELESGLATPRRWASVEVALRRTLTAARNRDRKEFREGLADLAEAAPHRAIGIGQDPVVDETPAVRGLVADLTTLIPPEKVAPSKAGKGAPLEAEKRSSADAD